jgi:hypothetical protein
MERPPTNPDAWITACVNNWKLGDLERRMTGEASVH